MKPLNKVKIQWSSGFAYAIGLLTTDGNLSIDGRHLDLTSKDKELLEKFLWCLNIAVKIGEKWSGDGKKYFRVQFGDVNFYKFLLGIGLTPRKSKTIASLNIPDRYFFDFLRGHFDGDGSFYSYWDPRWKSSFMFYTVFNSASLHHINWLKNKLGRLLNVNGHINKSRKDPTYKLKFAKKESLKLLPKMYYDASVICLERKRLKIENTLSIIGTQL